MPGRTRLKVPARRGDPAFFAAMAEKLRSGPGVITVAANPYVGSLLVHHQCTLAELTRYSREYGLFELDTRAQPPVALSQTMAHRHQHATDIVDRILGPEVDMRSLATLGLALMALAQLASGQVAPPAITLLWYTFSLVKPARPE